MQWSLTANDRQQLAVPAPRRLEMLRGVVRTVSMCSHHKRYHVQRTTMRVFIVKYLGWQFLRAQLLMLWLQ